MLWVDKYRPKTLDKLDYHKDLSERLRLMGSNGAIPHLLFFGPPGAGKRTRVMCLLKELYGNGVSKTKLDYRTFTSKSNKKIEITTVSSVFHIELNPSDAGNNDTIVIQEVIKEIAQTKQLHGSDKCPFKTIVLTEVDSLSNQAQAALRRTMEKYTSSCRLILICECLSKVIEPIRSRCLPIRIGAPTETEMMMIFQQICVKENIKLPDKIGYEIALNSRRNLRRGILMLEATKNNQYPFSEDGKTKILLPDWELFINNIAAEITKEQTPQKLLTIRDSLYELIANCIPASVILKTIIQQLIPKLDDTLKSNLMIIGAQFEERLNEGGKEIIHLEAFIAKFMAIYKQFIISMSEIDF